MRLYLRLLGWTFPRLLLKVLVLPIDSLSPSIYCFGIFGPASIQSFSPKSLPQIHITPVFPLVSDPSTSDSASRRTLVDHLKRIRTSHSSGRFESRLIHVNSTHKWVSAGRTFLIGHLILVTYNIFCDFCFVNL